MLQLHKQARVRPHSITPDTCRVLIGGTADLLGGGLGFEEEALALRDRLLNDLSSYLRSEVVAGAGSLVPSSSA